MRKLKGFDLLVGYCCKRTVS